MAKHNRKPWCFWEEDHYNGKAPVSFKTGLPATFTQNNLRNWRQTGHIMSYTGPTNFLYNPGFADIISQGNNDATCQYYIILHSIPKIDATAPRRKLGGVLIPWRMRTSYTTSTHSAVHSTPLIEWTPPGDAKVTLYQAYINDPNYGSNNYGTQVLTDGDMEAAGVGSWTASQSVLTKVTATPYEDLQSMRITASAAATLPCAKQTGVTTIGTTYRCRGVIKSDGTQVPAVWEPTGTVSLWVGEEGSENDDWQPFDFVYTAATTDIAFGFVHLGAAGTEWVEVDELEVLAQDNNIAGRRLTPDTRTTIHLWKGPNADEFDFEPAVGGAFNVGLLETTNIQTAALGVFSMPDLELTDAQQGVPVMNNVPGTPITGMPGTPGSVSTSMHMTGFSSEHYDGMEQNTRRCFWQFCHPRGLYIEDWEDDYIIDLGIPVNTRNLTGIPEDLSVPSMHDTCRVAIVVTTTNCTEGYPITLEFINPEAGTRTFTFTSNVTATLFDDTDTDEGTPLPIYGWDICQIGVRADVPTGNSTALLIHTMSLWEDTAW